MKALTPVVKAALLAGVFEGVIIAAHLLLTGLGPPRGPGEVLGDVAGVVALHLVAWLAVGALLLAVTRDPFSLFRATLTAWAAAAFLARRLLEEQTGPAAHVLLIVVLLGLWLPPRSWRAKLRPVYQVTLATAAVLVVSTYSLWNHAMDYRHDIAVVGKVYLAATTLAVIVVLVLSRWPRAAGASLLLGAGAVALWAHLDRAGAAERPSVLFILSDTTRRDHVSPFGDRAQTPAIEGLASRGVAFSDAVTVIPKTAQSVASFLTGRYPVNHGVRDLYDNLSPSQPNLARAFQSAGYSTAALVNNPWISRAHGFGHGFDRYYGTDEVKWGFRGGRRFVIWDVLYDRAVRQRLEWQPRPREGVFEARASELTNAAIAVLRSQRQPFFLYVHYFQPHWPYFPPPDLQERYHAPPPEKSVVNFIEDSPWGLKQMIFENPLPEEENEGARRLYQGEVDDTMAEVGRLLEALDDSRWGDDTIVVFTADHGHSLGEHDYHFHHGAFLYDATVRIPLILSWPGHLPEGRTVEAQVRSIDVAPTLAELASVEIEGPLDGRSLSGFWTGDAERPREAFVESDVRMMKSNRRREVGGVLGKLRAWRTGPQKLILTPALAGPRFELFDLVADPQELRDRSGEESRHSDVVAHRERLSEALPENERGALGPIAPEDEAGGIDGDEEEGVSEQEIEMLRQLGYVE